MQNHELLTMVMFTHNRPAFLARAVRYYSYFPYRLLVVDSSPESNQSIADQYGNSRTDYYHCKLNYKEVILKAKITLSLVKTPFTVFICDDDFTLQSALQNSLEFMVNSPDYAACMGYSLLYVATSDQIHYLAREIKTIDDFNDENSLDRIKKLFGHYYPFSYAVTQTEMQRNWFFRIPDDLNFVYLEFGHAFQLMKLGKLKILPIPYAIRELNYPSSEHQSDMLTLLSDQTSIETEKNAFYNLLASFLTETEKSLTMPEAIQFVEKSVNLLVESLSTGKTLIARQVFSSEWKTLADKPEWNFISNDFYYKPFCSRDFFCQLEKIDFLIRAMPCGKHQLAQLDPKLTIQHQIIEQSIDAKNQGNHSLATELLSSVIMQNPFNSKALSLFASLLSESGYRAEAKRIFERAKEIDPLLDGAPGV